MNKTQHLTLALFISLFTSNALASPSNDELLKQIEALTQRVEALEKQFQANATKPAPSPGRTADIPPTPWQQLSIGMKEREVEALLGKPSSKQKGSVALWFYSDKRKDGPFVKFVFQQVHSWRGPADEPNTP